jgi:hypothetical protein
MTKTTRMTSARLVAQGRLRTPVVMEYRDTVYLAGFGDSCSATRAHRSSLIVPGGLPVIARASGDALSVLHTVISDWPT